MAALSNLDTSESGPSVGGDYTKELSERFGVGALGEWANAGAREAMFAATVDWKPGRNIKVVFAPGFVLEKEDDGSRSAVFAFRTGLAGEFKMHHVPPAPTVYLDLVNTAEGVDVHLVYGLTIEIPF